MHKKITRQIERKIVHLYQTGKSNKDISQQTGVGIRKIMYSVQKAHAEWGELPDDSPMPLIYEDYEEMESKRTKELRTKQATCLHSVVKCAKCGLCQDNTHDGLQSEIKRLEGVIELLEARLSANM